jgi:hypothetical protein
MTTRYCPRCRAWREGEHGHAPTLFDVPTENLARIEDPITSGVAARRLTNAETHRGRLLRVIAQRPQTAEEAAHTAHIDAWQASKRVSDLKNLGYVTATGEHREGSAGRPQQVLAITESGRRALREAVPA